MDNKEIINKINVNNGFHGDWGLGIGDWGLGIGDWGLGPIPNPQSPSLVQCLLFLLYYTYYSI